MLLVALLLALSEHWIAAYILSGIACTYVLGYFIVLFSMPPDFFDPPYRRIWSWAALAAVLFPGMG